MEDIVLKGEIRKRRGRRPNARLRQEGWVPAVIFGHGEENLSVKVRAKEITKCVEDGHHMCSIDLDGKIEDGMLSDLQFDTYGEHIIHFDFTRVSRDEIIEVSIPVETLGNAKGVASGGVLDIAHHDVTLQGKARLIPEKIVIDVTELAAGEAVRAKQVDLPEGVSMLLGDEEPVVIVHAPKGEAPAAAGDEEAEATAE